MPNLRECCKHAGSAALFLKGRYLGTRGLPQKDISRLPACGVPAPMPVCGTAAGGQAIAKKAIAAAGAPALLQMSVYRPAIHVYGDDLAFVTVEVAGQQGI